MKFYVGSLIFACHCILSNDQRHHNDKIKRNAAGYQNYCWIHVKGEMIHPTNNSLNSFEKYEIMTTLSNLGNTANSFS